ncbi:MAG: serine hydrolase [Balneolaceae bacterium]|nr:serine hydrolase [Balneolaceae bacterium]MDR9409683.1 serine hydrolase [Balneolaceae bacterium]
MNYRYLIIVALLFVLALFSSCDNSSTDSNIESGPIPSENLEAAREYALGTNNNPKGRALLVWHNGEILLEEYGPNFDGQELHTLFSGSKSFAGILAAIGVKEELFSFDTTLGELIPKWDPESDRGKVTIRQLLNLTSGIETASAGTVLTAEEWLAADMEFERGSTFVYGPTPFYIFSWIFVEIFEINPIDYLNSHLFSPLGLSRGEWDNMDFFYPNFAYGARYPALDWLQVGIMLMNGGTLNGTEIIPENLMNELLTPSNAETGYEVTFWLNTPVGQQKRPAITIPEHAKNQNTDKMISDVMPEDLFMKSGFLGQKLYVVPSLNLVIVRFGLIGAFEDEEFFLRLMEGVDQNTLE